MESYPAPRSPLVNTPVCDSDEEVFFGPVTDKELLKASKLKRRTQLYFPALSWEPRVSPNIRDTPTAVEKADMADNVKLSLSADSLETSSFTTCDKLQDSSKGEFWSAHSENSSDLDSQSFENRAVMNFKCSDDSLEVDKPMPSRKITSQRAGGDCDGSSSGYFPISGSCSNISEDSLEDNAQLITGTGGREKNSQDNSVSTGLSSIAFSGSEISRHNQGMLADASCLALDSYFSNNSLQLLSASKKQHSDNWACNEENVSASTYNIIPDTDRNNTFTVEDETGLSASASKLCEPVQDLPKEDIADGDGGYLSILSEAAMYHAVQCNYKSSLQPLKLEESANTSQSLEDRFKNFGIDAAELEDQMLTSSILYETGRESNIITSEPESRTFYTGNNSSGKSSLDTFNPSRHTTQGHLGDVSSLSSLDFQWFPSQHITSGSQQSDCASLHQEGTLNRPIQSDTCNSSGSVCQNPREIEPCSQTTLTDSISKNLSYCSSSSGCSGEASAISGVCELNCVSKNQSSSSVQEEVVHSDSDASSLAEEMNDTLEEYEMMTRYGLDYILGHKGDRVKSNGKNNTGYSKEMEKESNCSKSPMNLNQNPNSSSLEYLDAVESSPSDNQEANCVTRNKTILSPPSKQILKTTPQQYLIASSGSSRNCHSKLPRFAPLTPVKTIESSAKTVLQTSSPQHAKHFARAVPLSSEIKLAFSKSSRQMMHTPEQKSSLFKKPVIPAIVPSRIPKSSGPSALTPRSMTKALEKIQSPVGAYIHNTPSPILVTNFKAKTCDRPAYEKEKHARALWRTGEVKSCIPRLGAALVSDVENVNPNINCGLPAVKYTKAPCVKLDENTKIPPPRVGEKISKLLDSPSPHVIKHEGRVRVNCGSPKLAAKMQSMADTFDDSLIDALSVSGDISVCVSQQVCRTNTLGH